MEGNAGERREGVVRGFQGVVRDCVLSARFTKAEDSEFRRLAETMSLSTKEMVRMVLMEWKSRQEAKRPAGLSGEPAGGQESHQPFTGRSDV